LRAERHTTALLPAGRSSHGMLGSGEWAIRTRDDPLLRSLLIIGSYRFELRFEKRDREIGRLEIEAPSPRRPSTPLPQHPTTPTPQHPISPTSCHPLIPSRPHPLIPTTATR